MNQILESYDKFKLKKRYNLTYKIIFYLSICIISIGLCIYFIKANKNRQNEQISKKLTDSYTISTLYSNNITYTATNMNENEDPFVIRYNKNR